MQATPLAPSLKKVILIAGALVFSAILASCASIPSPPPEIARGDMAAVKAYADQLVASEMSRNKVQGLSIAVVDDQRVVWAQGYGFADVVNKVPASANTLYRAGSVSKLFTAALVLQGVEQGKWRLDEPVSKYLPNFHPVGPNAQDITLRQVMTHHAGLPRDRLQGMFTSQPQPFTQVVETLNSESLAYAPGQVFAYSNLGFSLLGTVVQADAGKPFEQTMQHSLLAPLGMDHSSFSASPVNSDGMAKAYRGNEEAPEPALRDIPAGGLITSVNDMTRFIQMVFANGRSGANQVLTPQTIAAMLRAQNTQSVLDMGFQVGLPWMLSTLGSNSIQGAGPVAHHSGATIRHRSQLYLLPRHKLGIVVLANTDTATGVVDKIAVETLKLALQAKTGIVQPPFQRPAWDDGALTADEAQRLAGVYTSVAGPLAIRANGNKLAVEVGGQTLALRKRVDGLFGLDFSLLGLVSINLGSLGDTGFSVRQAEGRQLLVGSALGQDMLLGERLAPPGDLGVWRHRLGDYKISNPDAISEGYQVRLAEEKGYLVVEITHPQETMDTGKLVLQPVTENRALVLAALADSGESLHAIQRDGQEQLSFSGYLLSKK